MIQKRFLGALTALSAVVIACGSGSIDSGGDGTAGTGSSAGASNPGGGKDSGPSGGSTNPGAGAPSNPGSGGTTGSSGSGNASGGVAGDPSTCVTGVPVTTQIPRMLNRQYDLVVKELLGVTTIADNKVPSQVLYPDFDGPMLPEAWAAYQDVAAQIAKAVMSGASKSKFISCDPAAADCLAKTVKTFGRKAFRRPLTTDEEARFAKLGQTTPAGTPAEVAEATLQAFLESPSFLLLPELNQAKDSASQALLLSSYEVATRLSFMLWGSVPDDTLNAAADANMLQTKEQILAQAQRMIQVREKTAPLVASFHRDWLQMNNSSQHWWTLDHDKTKFPLYDAAKKTSWRAEMDAFFQEVAFGGGSFKDFFTSAVAFVNKDNAEIYGKNAADYGTELVKTQLDANQRPGFMTRVGFLSSYSGFNATSPILRGAFISVWMLGVNPGAPLPGATMKTVSGDFKTQRAYVEELTKPAECTGCHTGIINPPGFALENYDAVGKWQTQDPRGGAIDASVTTATVNFGGGKKVEITSPLQLMQNIADTKAAKEIYAKAWVSYAFGRDPNANDQCIVDQLNVKLAQNDYTVLKLLADLTQADSFRVRVRGTP